MALVEAWTAVVLSRINFHSTETMFPTCMHMTHLARTSSQLAHFSNRISKVGIRGACLQEYAKNQDQLTHFLTYADNNAVGYFSKQGFTKEITLDKEWVSLVGCPCSPTRAGFVNLRACYS